MIELTPQQQEQVEQWLERVLDVPAEARAAMLESDCNDPAVRAEVESLLAARPAADRLLNAPLADSAAFADALRHLSKHAADRTEPLEDPKQIGPYRILSRLGEGGMGLVYLAEQTEPLRRRVAIKIIKPGMDTRSVLRRFEAERQALALMNHPHVARVLDAGATPAGRPYFVMELVEGVRITEFCDANRLDTAGRLDLFLDVCDAIRHAHQKGLIHRDIKPSNVLVTEEDGSPSVKVIDFGVAKATSHRLTEQTLSTEHGVLIGTPEYMSPEQADPTADDIDTRSDIYSLGVLLYELLVGAPPLDAGSSAAVGFEEVRRIIRERDPVRPSTRLSSLGAAAEAAARNRRTDPATLQRQLRGDLDWIVMKCLEKDRDRRYGTTAELADDIERFVRHEPVAAGPPGMAYRLRKFARRNRALVVGAAAVSIVLLAGIISTAVFAVRESRQRAAAEAQAEATRAVNAFLDRMLASVDPRQRGPDVTVREVLDNAAARVETELADHPEIEQNIRGTIGRSYLALGLLDEALPHFRRAMDLAIELHGEQDARTTGAMHELGVLLRRQGRFGEAEALHRRTLAIESALFGEDSAEAARSLNDLAQVLYDQGRYDEGRPLFERAFEIRKREPGEADLSFITSLNNLARARYTDGDYAEAETLQREALRLMTNLFGASHLDTVGQMNNVAFLTMTNGRYDEAEVMFREVVKRYRAHYGKPHPDIARALNNLGECLRRQGRYDDAASIHREALDMRRETLGADHPLVAKSLNNLALTLTSLERYEEAIELHREALDIRQKRLGAEHPDVATTLNNLAFALYKTGACEEAREQYHQALAIRRRAYGDEHPQVANTQMNLARCLRAMEELTEAESWCRAALATQTRMLGEDHPHTAATMQELGRILTAAGRYEEAESSLLAALEILRGRFSEQSPQLRRIQEDLVALYDVWGLTGQAGSDRRSSDQLPGDPHD